MSCYSPSSNMTTNLTTAKNSSDQYSGIVKEFFPKLHVDMEKNQWTSKCKLCSLTISDIYQATSNFSKHLANKHQLTFDEWKANQNDFSSNSDKCRYFLLSNKNFR
jgi:hypothetical protein